MVHLAETLAAGHRFEHFALSASGLKDFLDRLNRDGERYEALRAPGNGVVQVNVWDPDGKHIRFPPENAVAVEFTKAARQSRRLKLAFIRSAWAGMGSTCRPFARCAVHLNSGCCLVPYLAHLGHVRRGVATKGAIAALDAVAERLLGEPSLSAVANAPLASEFAEAVLVCARAPSAAVIVVAVVASCASPTTPCNVGAGLFGAWGWIAEHLIGATYAPTADISRLASARYAINDLGGIGHAAKAFLITHQPPP